MARYEVDPISRIEGHLGVTLTVTGTAITDADVHGNLWRGFENFLIGRDPHDAITFTQRICGVCPLPHATASMFAIDGCYGYSPGYMTFPEDDYVSDANSRVTEAAAHIRNLVYAAEFVMSHITHFYHLAAPSYVQGPNIPPWTPYFAPSTYHNLLKAEGHGLDVDKGSGTDGYGEAPLNEHGFSADLWSAVIKSYVKALRMRRLTFEAGALFAGRMPMVASFVAGGTTNSFTGNELVEKCKIFYNMFREIGAFIFKEMIPINLALTTLYGEWDNTNNVKGASRLGATGLGYGAGHGHFLAWGAFPQPDDTAAIAGGYVFSSTSSGTISQLFMTKKADRDGSSGSSLFPGTFPDHDGNDWDASNLIVSSVDGTVPCSTANGTFYDAMALVQGALTEDVARSRYSTTDADGNTAFGYVDSHGYTNLSASAQFPGFVTRTKPDRTSQNKYSWLKAPRWMGRPMEVGPFARLVVNGWYPTNGAAIVNNAAFFDANWPSDANGVFANPSTYVHSIGATVGINPALLEADLAVALVREGLAAVFARTGSEDALVDRAYLSTIDTGTQQTITDLWLRQNSFAGADTVVVNGTLLDNSRTTGLVTDIAGLKGGLSTLDRLRGRALEAAVLVQLMIGAVTSVSPSAGTEGMVFGNSAGTSPTKNGWIGALADTDGKCFPSTPLDHPTNVGPILGVSEAPRGALAHFATVEKGKISAYQCVVPTTWNASPKDSAGQRGPIEQAMVAGSFGTATPFNASVVSFTSINGTTGIDNAAPLRVAQSFDPCIACAVH